MRVRLQPGHGSSGGSTLAVSVSEPAVLNHLLLKSAFGEGWPGWLRIGVIRQIGSPSNHFGVYSVALIWDDLPSYFGFYALNLLIQDYGHASLKTFVNKEFLLGWEKAFEDTWLPLDQFGDRMDDYIDGACGDFDGEAP